MRSVTNRLYQSAVVRIIVGFMLAALFLAGFGWLVNGPYRDLVSGFDVSIRHAMRQMQSPMWTSLLLAVTNLGSTVYLAIIGSIAGIVFLAFRWFRPFLLFVVGMIGQAALHHGGKWLVARPRPSALISYRTAEGFSFPSGHALSALCMYGLIAWIITRQIETPALKIGIAIPAAVLIFLIGLSRVYIGVHYPTDVIGGFAAAAIWTGFVISVDRRQL